MTQWSENYVCLGTKKAYDNAHLKPRELADYTWQEVLYLLHPGIHYTDNSQNKSIWTETPIIGDVPGYYVHSPLHWLLIYLYIRNKKLQLTNSVLNTRHDLYQLLNAIWNVLFILLSTISSDISCKCFHTVAAVKLIFDILEKWFKSN